MKTKNILVTTFALSLIAFGLTACVTEKQEQARLAAEAKVSRAQAEQIALAKVPGGKVKDAELEKEDGKLIWSFDIVTPGTKDITEVQVDALTGAVIDVTKETVAQQEKEKEEDGKGKKEEENEKEEKK